MKQIDERGNACPIPVVHTKKALESMDGETKLIVLVDNEPAVQNVTRFAEGKNCEVKSEKISDNEFKIEIMAENYTCLLYTSKQQEQRSHKERSKLMMRSLKKSKKEVWQKEMS